MTVGPILIVMRLADMERHHPEQITAKCFRCGHDVGVFPSGQQVLRADPDVEIVCSVCKMPGPGARLAPGAEAEPGQTRRRS